MQYLKVYIIFTTLCNYGHNDNCNSSNNGCQIITRMMMKRKNVVTSSWATKWWNNVEYSLAGEVRVMAGAFYRCTWTTKWWIVILAGKWNWCRGSCLVHDARVHGPRNDQMYQLASEVYVTTGAFFTWCSSPWTTEWSNVSAGKLTLCDGGCLLPRVRVHGPQNDQMY